MARRRNTQEKKELVKLVVVSGYSMREVCRMKQVSKTTLRNWVYKYKDIVLNEQNNNCSTCSKGKITELYFELEERYFALCEQLMGLEQRYSVLAKEYMEQASILSEML